MRFLHTSDWHLGRSLLGVDLHEAQQQVVEQLVELVDARGVDAVLIAGDVFDRAVPPVSAVKLWGSALRQLSDRVPVVVLPGNHDSAARLGVGADLFRPGVHLVTDPATAGTPVILRDADGPVHVYPLPFLDPDVARHTLAGDEPIARSHQAVMAAAMHRVRADRADRAQHSSSAPARTVVMAHAFVVGGLVGGPGGGTGGGTAGDSAEEPERSDSERDLRVGGVESVPVSLFDGIDYVALGHLHGAQQVRGAASGRVHYSGSPLRYSFSECHQVKQVLLVDLAADGEVAVEAVPLRQPRAMRTVSGELAHLLSAPELAEAETCWLQVTVTDAARPPEMRARVRERFPHALVVRHVPHSGPLAAGAADVRVPASPLEAAESFVRYVTGGDITPDELAVFEAAYEHVQAAGREG